MSYYLKLRAAAARREADMRTIIILGAGAAFAASLLHQAPAAADGLAAVWRPGTGTQWCRSGMTGAQFTAQDTTYFNQGLRIRSLAIRNGKFAAVWQPGTGVQWWRSGMSVDQFKAQDDIYFRQGLRIAVLEVDNGR